MQKLSNISRHFSSSLKKSYDYIVIGAGSGGIASARRAAQHGADVLLIEQRRVGGTCVNVGCVPKKVMFNLATYLEDSHDVMHHYGVKADVSLDFNHFKKARDNYVLRLNDIYTTNIKASGITYVEGMGKFVGPNRINIGQDHYEAKNILIAAGGEPEAGSFPGADLCMNSNDVFDLETLPESIAVIGGGYIGIELAQILHALGVKTTVIIRSIPLRFVDREVVDILVHSMKQSGMDVRLESPHESVVHEADGSYTVNLKDGQKINSEKVLLAMGRPPSTKGLGLETTGVEIAKSGHVVVDEFQNTNQQGVYAVGDVTVCPALTPVAVRAGRILSERLFNNRTDLKMDYDLVPTTIFSHPPIGTVGLSEEDAVKAYGKENVSSYKSSFVNMFYGLMPPDSKSPERPKSMFKMITHHEPEGVERVVGVHGIGRGIDEMMQTTAVAMKMGASKQDFDNTVAIHPTASEELVLMDTKYV